MIVCTLVNVFPSASRILSFTVPQIVVMRAVYQKFIQQPAMVSRSASSRQQPTVLARDQAMQQRRMLQVFR